MVKTPRIVRMPMKISDLTSSDLEMTRLVGSVELRVDPRLGGYGVAKRPENPGYYWGNFLLLEEAPSSPAALDAWIALARGCFAETASRHVSLRWDGAAISGAACAHAQKLGMQEDSGLELSAPHTACVSSPRGFEIRELTIARERDAIVELNLACDPSEQSAGRDYRAFKERMRNEWWRYCASGAASWWGSFASGRLVAQCGIVRCAQGLARFQSVETHPEFRRRGICSALISRVAREAHDTGARKLLLGVDPEGPAIGLYEGLGFVRGATQRSLVLGASELRIREAAPGDLAELQSLVRACDLDFDLERSYAQARTRIDVAERAGTLLACAVWSARAEQIAVVDFVAVRPSQQRRGIGRALLESLLARARDMGVQVVAAVSHPFLAHHGVSELRVD